MISRPFQDTDVAADEPGRWLRSTQLIDLEDSKLRLRVRALTQLCQTERERVLAVYGYVKRLTFARPMKLGLHTARQVIEAGRGDADDKATLLVALLRLMRVPARLHYIELHGDILRGLTSKVASAARPLAEIWLGGRWVRTDTYIFDAAYMAAARQRLRDREWEWGYGIHCDGHTLWNGRDDAYLAGAPTADDPMVLEDLGLFNDPGELLLSPRWRARHPRMARSVQWNMLAPGMTRVIRELRRESLGSAPSRLRKPS